MKTAKEKRIKRHIRVRGKVSGTSERPRLNVFRSGTNIYAQIIDDTKGVTLVSASSLPNSPITSWGMVVPDRVMVNMFFLAASSAAKVGEAIGQRAKDKGIDTVVFDRGGYLYHGRVAELAEGAREGGLEF